MRFMSFKEIVAFLSRNIKMNFVVFVVMEKKILILIYIFEMKLKFGGRDVLFMKIVMMITISMFFVHV